MSDEEDTYYTTDYELTQEFIISDPYGILTTDDLEAARKATHAKVDEAFDAAVLGKRKVDVRAQSRVVTPISRKRGQKLERNAK